MNFKTTYILAGTLAGLVAVFVLVRAFGHKPGNDTYVMSDMHRANVKATDIQTVEIERTRPKAEKVVFAREGKTWHMTAPHPFRIQSFMVENLVDAVIDARKDQDTDLSTDKAQYGLDTPAEVVTLQAEDGRQWKLRLGSERLGRVYVTTSADPDTPVSVTRTSLDALFKNVNDFREKSLLTANETDVQEVTVAAWSTPKAIHTPLKLEHEKSGKWRYIFPNYGTADAHGTFAAPDVNPKDITGVDQLVRAIDGIRVATDADFVADGVKDWARYGLDKPSLKIVVKQKQTGSEGDGKTTTHTLWIGKKEDKGDKVYARLDNEDSVVRVSASEVEPLKKVALDPGLLRNRDLVDVLRSQVDAIDVQNAAGRLKLRRVAGNWQLFDAKGKGTKVQNQEVEELLTSLTRRREIVSFPDPAKEGELGFDKPAAVVSIWVDGLAAEPKKDTTADKKDAKKDAKKPENKAEAEPKLKDPQKPTVQLIFGKKVGNDVNVRRLVGTEKTLATVPATVLEKAERGRLAYLDRTLPTFPSVDDVTKLVLQRNGQTFEITRDEKDKAVWKLKQPPEQGVRTADPHNVGQILTDLKFLTAERLVAEKPSDAQLAADGLKPPKMSATVILKDGKKYEYVFGNKDKDGVLAKEGGSDLVFVPRPDFERRGIDQVLQSELRARNLFQFKPESVKEVKVAGWKPVYKTFSLSLDLVRQPDKTWKVKQGPADFKLEQDKVNGLLQDLVDVNQPLVERFLEGGVKPQYKLGKDERQLEMELVMDDGKTTTLTVGALDPKSNAYYAQSNVSPKDVFLVPKAKLEKLLAGAEYFSKK